MNALKEVAKAKAMVLPLMDMLLAKVPVHRHPLAPSLSFPVEAYPLKLGQMKLWRQARRGTPRTCACLTLQPSRSLVTTTRSRTLSYSMTHGEALWQQRQARLGRSRHRHHHSMLLRGQAIGRVRPRRGHRCSHRLLLIRAWTTRTSSPAHIHKSLGHAAGIMQGCLHRLHMVTPHLWKQVL